ncbi:hypothetical protein [Xanthomonas oryzae]|uniref:hypothetical protein n=1 Tax=Xanthomonas oryzae TaxID=347 RepID=UPI000A5FD2AC|nr:hypothetical protein [Xanthomonas oryzae]UWI55353.1 hypothetical protein NO430_11020 [Xanthomonas oryzae pv. oryzae]
MIKYLRSKGVVIPENTGNAAVVKALRSEWSTNQFFSTSTGDELASLAGRALVWVIHIDPARTRSRDGGSYVSESEVLFPYETPFHLYGYAEVSSLEQIAQVDLNGLPRSTLLRDRMHQIYAKGGSTWPGNRCRFLFAEEQ